jgi:hypothetical protein
MAMTAAHRTGAPSVAGMRRVDYVRMIEDTRVRFVAVGIGHRLPAEREISAAVARELMQTVPVRHEWSRTGA